MYLFKERRDTLQGGMINSMQVSITLVFAHRLEEVYGSLTTSNWQYLYLDSEVWNSARNFLWRE